MLSGLSFGIINKRSFSIFSSIRPVLLGENTLVRQSPMTVVSPFISQKRFKSRGNTFQPSTLKRKRRFGFLAKAKDKLKSKILKDRKKKGRWYLTH